MARVPYGSKWKAKLLDNAKGTPDRPIPAGLDDKLVEEHLAPHEGADQELQDLLSRDDADIGPQTHGTNGIVLKNKTVFAMAIHMMVSDALDYSLGKTDYKQSH